MKNHKEFEKLAKEGKKSVFLKKEEKQIMKSELLDFVKKHPLEDYNKSLSWSLFASFQSPALKYASILSVLSLVIFSGVSFAANDSLPGDALYSVKVGVNEKVLGLLQVSDESKAQYNIELAELRLQEIEEISTKEDLDEKIKENVSYLLDKHIDNVKKRSIKIEGENNSEVALKINSQLEASLNAHKEVLDKLSKEKTVSENIQGVLLNVNEKIINVKKHRQENEDTFSNRPSIDVKYSAEGKIKSAENKIEEVEKFIESRKDLLSEESFETAKSNLELAKSVIEKGKKLMESGNYQEAFFSFQKAIRMAQEAQISVQASIHLEIDVFEVKDRNGDDDHDEDEEDEDSSKIDLSSVIGISN